MRTLQAEKYWISKDKQDIGCFTNDLYDYMTRNETSFVHAQ